MWVHSTRGVCAWAVKAGSGKLNVRWIVRWKKMKCSCIYSVEKHTKYISLQIRVLNSWCHLSSWVSTWDAARKFWIFEISSVKSLPLATMIRSRELPDTENVSERPVYLGLLTLIGEGIALEDPQSYFFPPLRDHRGSRVNRPWRTLSFSTELRVCSWQNLGPPMYNRNLNLPRLQGYSAAWFQNSDGARILRQNRNIFPGWGHIVCFDTFPSLVPLHSGACLQ